MVLEDIHHALGTVDVAIAIMVYAGWRRKVYRGAQLYRVPDESLVAILTLLGYCKSSRGHLRLLAYVVDAGLLWSHVGPRGSMQVEPLVFTVLMGYLASAY